MSYLHKQTLILTMTVSLALAVLLIALCAQPIPAAPLNLPPPQFEADRALADATQLAQDFPDRVVGSATGKRAHDWLAARFAELGLQTETLPFSVIVASEARLGSQLWASSPGQSDEIILITAHYDVTHTDAPGAADDASGIGVLLELARLFATEPHRRTFYFMASDSEEYGSFWGAKNFLEQFEARDKIVAVLDLDYLNPYQLARINQDGRGLRQGYAPLWVRQIGLSAIEAAGAEAGEADGVWEYLFRAVPIGQADAAMYQWWGIPALTFGSLSTHPAEDEAIYHTPQDTPDKLERGAFEIYGRAAENFVRAVDALDPRPANPATYFRLSRDYSVPGWVMSLVQLIWFTPLFVTTWLEWRTYRPRLADLWAELWPFFGWLIAIVDGYAVAYALVNLRLLPLYEMYPASPRDPFLLTPPWWAVALIFGTVVFFAWQTFRENGWGQTADAQESRYRRSALLILFSALVIGVWFLNGYALTTFLGLAAYTWLWIEPSTTLRGRGLNFGLALAGALPFLFIADFMTSSFPIGPWWWYLTLGAVYGLFPLTAVAAFVYSAALFARFWGYGWRGD